MPFGWKRKTAMAISVSGTVRDAIARLPEDQREADDEGHGQEAETA
jgi:hypothetical protein